MRFYVDRTSPLEPIQLLRTPGLRRRAAWRNRCPAADVLLVSLGGTAGLREADAELAGSLRAGGRVGRRRAAPRGRASGARMARDRARVGARRARGARRAAIDGAPAARGALLDRPPPRCSRPRPGAIRFDAPAAGNRPGRHGIWQRPVERRRFARRAAARAVERRAGWPRRRARTPTRSSCPSRSSPRGPLGRARDVAAVTYGANPEKKGLDRVLAAWRARAAARARSCSWSPASTAGCGARPPGCAGACGSRGCAARVPGAAAAGAACSSRAPRREDYGIAQLEALADGCRLVTTPRRGRTRRCRSRASSTRGSSATTSPGAIRDRARRPAAGLRGARPRERSPRARRAAVDAVVRGRAAAAAAGLTPPSRRRAARPSTAATVPREVGRRAAAPRPPRPRRTTARAPGGRRPELG